MSSRAFRSENGDLEKDGRASRITMVRMGSPVRVRKSAPDGERVRGQVLSPDLFVAWAAIRIKRNAQRAFFCYNTLSAGGVAVVEAQLQKPNPLNGISFFGRKFGDGEGEV